MASDFLLQPIYAEGGELFTALLAGGLGGDERPGTHPRRAKGMGGKQLAAPALLHSQLPS